MWHIGFNLQNPYRAQPLATTKPDTYATQLSNKQRNMYIYEHKVWNKIPWSYTCISEHNQAFSQEYSAAVYC